MGRTPPTEGTPRRTHTSFPPIWGPQTLRRFRGPSCSHPTPQAKVLLAKTESLWGVGESSPAAAMQVGPMESHTFAFCGIIPFVSQALVPNDMVSEPRL